MSPRGSALAHGVLIDSSIAPGALLAAFPASLTLRFSEGLATSLCSVRVTGPDGREVAAPPRPAPDSQSLQVLLQPHSGGTYTVAWSAASAEDGQVVTGAFRFAVGYMSASSPHDPAAAPATSALRITTLLATVLYWMLLLATLIWAGGALFEVPVGMATAGPALAGADAWIAVVSPRARIVRRRVLEILLGVLAFGWLIAAAQVATTGAASLAGGFFGAMGSRLGLLRFVELAAALLALLDLQRAAGASSTPAPAAPPSTLAPRRVARRVRTLAARPSLGRWAHAALAALFLLALAASSHAAGIPQITLSAVLLAWIHLLASASWIGIVAYLVLVAIPAVQDLELDRRAPLIIALLRRYIPFALAGVVVLAVTGLFAGQSEGGSPTRLLNTTYGRALGLKGIAIALIALLTLYTLYAQRRQLERHWGQRQRLESLATLQRIGRAFRAGVALGTLILAATAVLWSHVPSIATPLPPVVARTVPLPSGAWQPAGLSRTSIARLVFDPSDRHILWVAGTTGIWRSVDDQRTWVQRGPRRGKLAVLDLLVIDGGSGLLAAGADGQLYRTYDAGMHWQRLGRPFGAQPLRALASSGRVLVAAGDGGLYRSVDDSRHWHLVGTADGQGIRTIFWSAASRRFLAGVVRGPWQIVSADSDAASWQPLPGAPGVQHGLTTLAQSGTGLVRTFAGTDGDGLWASDAPAGPWSRLAGLREATVRAVLDDGYILGRLYLAAGNAVFGSADGGATWVPLGDAAPRAAQCLAMRPGPTRILYAGTASGIFRLTVGS